LSDVCATDEGLEERKQQAACAAIRTARRVVPLSLNLALLLQDSRLAKCGQIERNAGDHARTLGNHHQPRFVQQKEVGSE
jgi:hypothetical protein